MKKLIAWALLALSCPVALAGANDIVFTKRNATDTGSGPVTPAHPLTSGLVIYDVSILGPGYVTLGSCLEFSSGVLVVKSNCVPVQADWNATSGLAQILNKPAIPAPQVQSDWAAASGVSAILNKPTIPAAQVQSDWTASTGVAAILNKPTTVAASGITDAATTSALATGLATKFNQPAGTTAQYVRGDGSLATLPSPAARSFGYQTRALNACFQVSSSRDALVSYSVDIATTLSLTSGQQGTVYLRTFSNSTCTAGTQELTRFVNGQTGSLTVGLNLTQNVTGTLTGVVPAGAWVQLVTENNTGTPTFTARPGQEVLL